MIEVKTKNLNRIKKRFRKMVDKCKNPRHMMDIIGAKAFKEVIENFNKENPKNEDGTKWKKWKYKGKRVSTRPTKRGGTKLLQDTGRLRNSIRWAASNIEARVFTIVKYAVYHDSDRPRKKLPRRQFMWVPQKKINEFTRMLLTYIKG